MKPLMVTMQAFGPYVEKTDCDFSLLGENRLFLICGQTGGGKTTILDAMSFALYGCATGSLRTFRDMRSLSAPLNTDTQVSYTFLLRGTVYRFARSLHLHRKRSGELDEQNQAIAERKTQEGWELICSGTREVPAFAQELLGFTGAQFSQVVVLPQGEFRKLLVANSREKTQLLQVLFGTGRWQKLTERLGARVKELESSLKEHRARREAVLQQVGCDTVEDLDGQWKETGKLLELAQTELSQKTNALLKATASMEQGKSVAADLDTLEQVKGQLKELRKQEQGQKERSQRLEQLRAAASVRPYSQERVNAKAALEQVSQQQERLLQVYSSAQKRAEEAQRLEEKILKLESQLEDIGKQTEKARVRLPLAKRRLELQSRLKQLQKDEESARQQSDTQKQKVKETEARIQKGEAWLNATYDSTISQLAQWTQKAQEAQRLVTVAQAVEVLQKERDELSAETIRLEQSVAAAVQEWEAAQAQVVQIEALMRQNSAAALSEALVEGKPCPVCGSTEHPRPAHSANLPISAQTCRAMAEECRRQKEELVAQLAACQARKKSKDEEWKWKTEELGSADFTQISAAAQEWNTKTQQGEAIQKQYQTAQVKLAQLKEKLPRHRQALEEQQSLLTQTREEKARVESGLQECPATESVTELELRLQQLEEISRQGKTQLEQWRNEKETAANELAAAMAGLAQGKTAYGQANQRWKQAKQAEEEARKQAHLPDGEELEALYRDLPRRELLEEECHRYREEVAAAKENEKLLQTRTQDQVRPNMEELQARVEKAQAAAEACREQWGSINARMEQLQRARDTLTQLLGASSRQEEEYRRMARVYRYCSGNNVSKTPLSNFVLGLLLDDVTQEASRYLARLSKDRYSLVRTDEGSGNGYRGLDIEVMDAYKGGRRKVGTLSGGELFLASLSLAFGLAQVVQSYAGGIQLDSLFIDEGFGTLDGETLDAAMSALSEIEKSGRMVGLISHVSEMRSRIFARIEVQPGETGSRLRVIG